MTVGGQLNGIRRLTETTSDLNTALMSKLTKVDGAVDSLVSASLKLDKRIEAIEGHLGSMEKEWMVFSSAL
jgi:hypothetical protein